VCISTIMSGTDTERAEEAQGVNKQASAGLDPGSAPSHPPQPVLWAGDPVALSGDQDDGASTIQQAAVPAPVRRPTAQRLCAFRRSRLRSPRSPDRRVKMAVDPAAADQIEIQTRRVDLRDDPQTPSVTITAMIVAGRSIPGKVAVTGPTRTTMTTTMMTAVKVAL
jgi:hypothetical protein